MKKHGILSLLLFGITALYSQTCSNHSLQFDGTSDFVESAAAPVTGDANFTIEARFTCTSSGTSFRRLFALGGTNTRIEVGESNGLLRFFRQSSSGSATTGLPGASIRNNGWHHIAARRNGNQLTFFVDCDSVYTTTFPGTLNISAFHLGNPAVTTSGTVWWAGEMDEVRAWSTVRSYQQIIDNCSCGLTGTETGLKLYYDFDQAGIIPGGANPGQATVQDETVNNNDGTLNSFALTGATSNWLCGDPNFAASCNNCPADFTYSLNPCNRTVAFNNQTAPIGSYSYSWTFGDGGTSTQTSPSHTYATAGVRDVCLTVMAPTGAVVCTVCQTINVTGDQQAPSAVCALPFSIVIPAGGFAQVTPAMINNGSSDNCGLAGVQINTDGFGCQDICGPNGPNHVVMLIATDLSGNTSTCTTIVSVADNTPPAVSCKNTTLYFTGAGPLAINPSDVDNGSTDNCDIVNMDVSPNFFECPMQCEEVHTVVFTATDCSGNTGTCTAQVTLIDVGAPAMLCPPNTTIDGTPGPNGCFGTFTPGPLFAVDNCSAVSVICFVNSGSGPIPPGATITLPVGVSTIHCIATDNCGNSTECNYQVTVLDCGGGPVCQCGGFTNIQIDPFPAGGQTLLGICDTNIYLPCPSEGVIVTGQFACEGDSCTPANLVWELHNSTGATIGSGSLSGTNFSLTLSTSLLSAPGTYPLFLSGHCGQMICQCRMWLVVPDCTPPNDDALCGQSVVTCYGKTGEPAAALYDTRFNSQAPAGQDWHNPSSGTPVPKTMFPNWSVDRLGNVFGIAIDQYENVYFAATNIYIEYTAPAYAGVFVGPAGAGGIYKADGANLNNVTDLITSVGNVSVAGTANIPNTGGVTTINGIGNIAYDKAHHQLFATNLEDGRLYRINLTTNLVEDAYDPFNPDDGTNGVAPKSERIWGVGVFTNGGITKVYFSREANGTMANAVYSITLTPSGGLPGVGAAGVFTGGGEVLEFECGQLPGLICSSSQNMKITDIAFAHDGKMLIAERGPNPHQAWVYELTPSGATWAVNQSIATGGTGGSIQGHNSAGGVDYGYGEQNGNATAECDALIWATGNYMMKSDAPTCCIYGLEGINAATGNSNTTNASTDIFIDFDDNYNTEDKSLIGDVEVFKCKDCPPHCDPNCAVDLLDLSTGYDQNTNTLIANGAYDVDWTLIDSPDGISVPTPAFVSGNIVPASWANQTGATYISAYPHTLNNAANLDPKKPYVFENCFCICADSSTITINLSVHVDNLVDIGLYTSGGVLIATLLTVTVPTSTAFTNPPATATFTTTLNTGTYCIRAKMRNAHQGSPMGLNMQCTVSGQGLIRKECCAPSNSIVGEKYFDKNCNGERGNALVEAGLPGWTIQLCDPITNTVVASAVTDAFGYYQFNNVIPGTYTIKEVNQPGYNQTEPTTGTYTVTIGENEVAGPYPFGNCRPLSDTCDLITAVSIPDTSGGCCHILKLDNSKPGYFTAIGISVLSGGTLSSNPEEFPGWLQQSFGSAPYFVPAAGGTIPVGESDVTRFCIDNITADTQCIEVVYYAGQEIVCRDTLKVFCTRCVEIIPTRVECTGVQQFSLNFCVKNSETQAWAARSVHLIAPAGVTISPAVFSLPSVPPGTTYCSLNATVTGGLPGQTVCFTAVIHKQDIAQGEPETNCCSDTFCLVLPDCDPCNPNITHADYVPQMYPGNECCIKITLHNPDFYYVGVGTQLSPGWEFCVVDNYPGSGWLLNPTTPADLWWTPSPGPYVTDGSMLPTLCICPDGTGTAGGSQQIIISWMAADQSICYDTLVVNCQDTVPPSEFGCTTIDEESVLCSPIAGLFLYNFTVHNHTDILPPSFTAGEVTLVQVPSGAAFGNTSFPTNIAPGGSASFSTTVSGNAGDQICFYAVLHQINDDSLHINCCPTGDTMCITLPNCIPLLKVYPNPARNQLNLAFSEPLPSAGQLRIIDMTGKVRLNPDDLPAGTKHSLVDLTELTNGIYVVEVRLSEWIALRSRFVVLRDGGAMLIPDK